MIFLGLLSEIGLHLSVQPATHNKQNILDLNLAA